MGVSSPAEIPRNFFKKVNPQGLGEGLRSAGQCGLSCPWSCKWPGEQGSGGGRAVHGGQEVSDLGPLGRADVLAHVHHAVQGHLRILFLILALVLRHFISKRCVTCFCNLME